MARKGSSCVVVNERSEVLLVLRHDVRIWALPGGGLEPGETWEQAAVRETLEETGYCVEILQYTGEYWRPQMARGRGDIKRVFLARATGGAPAPQKGESVAVRWFPSASLPRRMFRFSRQHIQDALARPSQPVRREQRLPAWMGAGLRAAYLLQDALETIFRRKHPGQEDP